MPYALISVSDKSGLPELGAALVQAGYELIASGGSARCLQEQGLQVLPSSEITGFDELLGGRVKTLHPHIHGGILARAAELPELAAQQIRAIDLIIVNLYPFARAISAEHSLEDAVENIDIGGVALLRAGAKNFQRVATICDPQDYPELIAALDTTETTRRRWAAKAFAHCAHYDSLIASYLNTGINTPPPAWRPHQALRYGENPQQSAQWLTHQNSTTGLSALCQVQGKQLSYNNLLDADLAASCAHDFPDCTWAIIKHASPCAIASDAQASTVEVLRRAWHADSESAFGGVLACNRSLDEAAARELADKFIEIVIAPEATPAALAILSSKSNLRVLLGAWQSDSQQRYRSVSGGVLSQSPNHGDLLGADWRVASRRQPSSEQMADLRFAFRAAKFVRSNAIVIGSQGTTLGLGGGQTSRVRSLQLAWQQAQQQAPADLLTDAVVASDGFFPFADSLEYACARGLLAFIAPGGSIRDSEVIATADAHDAVLVLTSQRHFLH